MSLMQILQFRRKKKLLPTEAQALALQLDEMESAALSKGVGALVGERLSFPCVQLSRHKQSEVAWEWLERNDIAQKVRSQSRFGKKIMQTLGFTHLKPGLL
ncbi:hypothetical protein HY250_01615 [Candidatus Azambacteria bacterium]|nr:hypothetical protein [Candidatus Azambacteria bacterium]MBI3685078.1 hypothetical protein [Candidatus Azambacteria bacterium]